MTKKQAEKLIPKLLSVLGSQHEETPPPALTEDPLEHLMLLILLEQETERRTERAMKHLRERFVDWNEVRVSSSFEIEQVIVGLADSAGKANRIKRVLEGIFTKHNALTLAALAEMPSDKALKHLLSINGIVWRDAAQLMLTRYNLPVLPLDDGIVRVAVRLGLCEDGASIEDSRKTFESLVPKRRFWEFFRYFQMHAEQACTADGYRCAKCPLVKDCTTGAMQAKAPVKKKQGAAGEAASRAKEAGTPRSAKKKTKKKTKRPK